MYTFLSRASLFAAAVIGMFGLHLLALHAGREPESPNRATVAIDYQTIWASQRLIDFAKKHDPLPPAEELQRLLKEAHFEGTWYAVENRFYFENGESEDLPKFLPADDWFGILAPTRQVLEILAGHPVTLTNDPESHPRIVVLDDEIFKQDPHQSFPALLERFH